MMGALRTAVSLLGNFEPELMGADPLVTADRLVARAWFRYWPLRRVGRIR